jgi:hypothetical protein
VRNNPTNANDPSGLLWIGWGFLIGGGAGGAIGSFQPSNWSPPAAYAKAVRNSYTPVKTIRSSDGRLYGEYTVDADTQLKQFIPTSYFTNAQREMPNVFANNPRRIGIDIRLRTNIQPPKGVRAIYVNYWFLQRRNIRNIDMPLASIGRGDWMTDNDPNHPVWDTTRDYEDVPGMNVPERRWFESAQFDIRMSFVVGVAFISCDEKRILDRLQGVIAFSMDVAGFVPSKGTAGGDDIVVDFTPNYAYGAGGINALTARRQWLNLLNKARGINAYEPVKTIAELQKT